MNDRLKTVRSIIERCNGVLKNRFRCLLGHRVLHYQPQKAALIVKAIVVLHNICIQNNIPEPDYGLEDVQFDFGIHEINENQNEVPNRANPDLLAGRQLQQQIIRVHFNN